MTAPIAVALPLRRELTDAYASSLAVALALAIASVAGLVLGTDGLHDPESPLVQVSRGGDAANLILGVPVLLGSVWLARRGSLIGGDDRLNWPHCAPASSIIPAIGIDVKGGAPRPQSSPKWRPCLLFVHGDQSGGTRTPGAGPGAGQGVMRDGAYQGHRGSVALHRGARQGSRSRR